MIEGDLRAVRSAPVPQPAPFAPAPEPFEPPAAAPHIAMAPPQAKPELPNPAASQAPPHFAAAPRDFGTPRIRSRDDAAGGRTARACPAPLAISEILRAAKRRRARSRSHPNCRPIIRSSRARGRAHAPLRRRSASPHPKTRSAKSRPRRRSRSPPRASSPPPAVPRRPPTPCSRSPTRPLREARQGPSQGRRQGRREAAIDRHVQDPLAAGRRERGRDRARHLQDGDEPARWRQRAADRRPMEKSDRTAVDAGACRQRRQGARAGAVGAAPSMTSPTPIGTAVPEQFRTARPTPPRPSKFRAKRRRFRPQRHHRRDSERVRDRQEIGNGAGAAERAPARRRSADRICARPR